MESDMQEDPGLRRKLKEGKDKIKKFMQKFMKKQAYDCEYGHMKDVHHQDPSWHHEVK